MKIHEFSSIAAVWIHIYERDICARLGLSFIEGPVRPTHKLATWIHIGCGLRFSCVEFLDDEVVKYRTRVAGTQNILCMKVSAAARMIHEGLASDLKRFKRIGGGA